MDRRVDVYVAGLAPAQRELVLRLRHLVRSAAPDATEAFKWAEPVYELNGPFAWIKAHREHVTLGFWRGAELGLEGSGTKMGHIKVHTAADINVARFRRLVKAAVKLNQTKGDPTKAR